MVPAEAKPPRLLVTQERGARTMPAGSQKSCKRARLGRPALVALLATGLLLGNLALRAQTINRGYRLSQLEQALAATQVEHDRLNLSATHLRSLERVEEVARAGLGMTDPVFAEYVVVAPGGRNQDTGKDANTPGFREPSGLEKGLLARTGDALIGLVSPFVARWFYDIPDSNHPRVRLR